MNSLITVLAAFGVALATYSVFQVFRSLIRKKREENFLIASLQQKFDLAKKLNEYERMVLENENTTEKEQKEFYKIRELLLKELDEEIHYILKNKKKFKETIKVVNTSPKVQKVKYLEKLLQKLVEIDVTPKLKV